MVFGLDLGTTNSCISMWDNGESQVVPNDLGEGTTASCVAFTKNGILVGKSAAKQQSNNPTNTIYEAKRVIGQTFDNIKSQLKYLPFKVEEDEENRPKYSVQLEGRTQMFDATDISAIVLKKVKEDTENRVKQKVLICPIHFTRFK